MRTWSIILGAVIFLCVVSVSFSHTVDLYQRVGFVRWEATVFTIAVETTFLLSGWSILWYRNKGEKPSGSAYAGFIYGVILVLFSNSAYTVGLDELFENKIAQWVLALSVVFGVLVAESIISQNLAELHQKDGDLQHDEERSLQNKEEVEKEREKVEEPTKEMENVSSPFDTSTPTTSSTPSNNLSITAPTSNPSNSTASNSSTLSTPTVEKERVEVEKEENQEENHQEVEENRRPTVETVEVEKEDVEKIALEIYEQEGRLPGRKRLMEEAGVSEWEARKTLQELRKKVG